jgi:AcrR family transcriptional regulator
MPRSAQVNKEIREETTERILEAAKTVFARKGMAAKMSEVAAAAGVSQGLAYHYFPSKGAIFIALLRQMSLPPNELYARYQKIPGTPAERLARIVSAMVDRRRKDPEFYQFLSQAISDDSLPSDIMEEMKTRGPLVHKILRQLIVEGQQAGEIAKDNPDKLVRAIAACLDGLSRMEPLSSEQLEREFPDASIILRMLRPDGRRE